MRAIHLPGVAVGVSPPFKFPDKSPSPSDLEFNPGQFPEPKLLSSSALTKTAYKLRVLTTALTRGEITWAEVLDPQRFKPEGGAIPGHDVVGIVEEVFTPASTTARFKPGDHVWGLLDFDRDGAAADYVTAYEDEVNMVPGCPPNVDRRQWNAQLATIPLSGLTAWQALFDHGALPKTPSSAEQKRVLVTGAAGSVGVLAIQLAKAAKHHVIAVCGARSSDFIKNELHADEIIEYTSSDFKSIPSTMRLQSIPEVDLVLDCTGGDILKAILLEEGCVKPGGKVITIAAPIKVFGPEIAQEIERRGLEKDIEHVFFIVKPNSSQMEDLAKAVEDGSLTSFLDSTFDLVDGGKAMEKVEGRGTVSKGKVAIVVNEQ